jgi:S-adenosylmethionine-diacylglycerol 3-amino-3-carboxypropyl transferase
MKRHNHLKEARHDYIRYANVWEDARVMLQGLQAQSGAKHLSIASGGDNALMLLLTDPECVVAVDINHPQLALCALKKAAIRHLDCADYQKFIGFQEADDRLDTYQELRSTLSPQASAYWDEHLETIEMGAINQGKFERYFQLFVQRILPFIHSPKTVKALLAPKSEKDQIHFYETQWNTWRWRFLFRVFFSKRVMGWLGRDPEFLKQVDVNVGQFIFQKAEHHLKSTAAQHNFILKYNLTGHFGQLLPDYVQEENYVKIRNRIDRLILYEGLADAAVDRFGQFDYFNLSDIFEYMDMATFQQVGQGFAAGARPGARFVYWNLMVERNLAQSLPHLFKDEPALSASLSKEDRGFFYNKFIVNELA